MSDRLTEDKIETAIARMKPVIGRAGSARIGWALKKDDILGSGYSNTPTHLHKIAGKICESGQYVYHFMGNDCWIFINPDYEMHKSIKEANESIKKLNNVILPESYKAQDKASRLSLLLALLSVCFIVISTCLQFASNTDQRLKEVEQAILKKSNTLDSISIYLKVLGQKQNFQEIKTDTLH